MRALLKLGSLGPSDYSVLEGRQRIGRSASPPSANPPRGLRRLALGGELTRKNTVLPQPRPFRRGRTTANARKTAMHSPLKLRTIGINDYSVLEGRQRIGRIRFAAERMPASGSGMSASTCPAACRWDHAKDLDTAKFKAAWEALKASTTAGATRGGLQGHEHPERRLIEDIPHEKSPSGGRA